MCLHGIHSFQGDCREDSVKITIVVIALEQKVIKKQKNIMCKTRKYQVDLSCSY